MEGKCLTCRGSTDYYVDKEATSISFKCKVTYVRPVVTLTWTEPFVSGPQRTTPVRNCNKEFKDQESTGTAELDGTPALVVRCMSKSSHVNGLEILSDTVTIKYK